MRTARLFPSARLLVRALLLLPLSLAAAACCDTSEDVVSFERLPEHEGLDCREVCERTVIPVSTTDYAFAECDEGLSTDGSPLVICTFELTVCTRELH